MQMISPWIKLQWYRHTQGCIFALVVTQISWHNYYKQYYLVHHVHRNLSCRTTAMTPPVLKDQKVPAQRSIVYSWTCQKRPPCPERLHFSDRRGCLSRQVSFMHFIHVCSIKANEACEDYSLWQLALLGLIPRRNCHTVWTWWNVYTFLCDHDNYMDISNMYNGSGSQN